MQASHGRMLAVGRCGQIGDPLEMFPGSRNALLYEPAGLPPTLRVTFAEYTPKHTCLKAMICNGHCRRAAVCCEEMGCQQSSGLGVLPRAGMELSLPRLWAEGSLVLSMASRCARSCSAALILLWFRCTVLGIEAPRDPKVL